MNANGRTSFGAGRHFTGARVALLFVCLAVVMFLGVLNRDAFLFSTDDNIGAAQARQSFLRDGWLTGWDDSGLLGLHGNLAVCWTHLLLYVLPARLFVNWIHAADLALASILLCAFLRRLNLSLYASLAGALAALWVGSNFTLAYAGHIGKFEVLMWASCALWLIETAVQRKSIPVGLLAGGALGSMFQLQPDVALFFTLFLGPYAIYACWREHRLAPSALLRTLAPMMLTGALMVLPTVALQYDASAHVAATDAERPTEKWNFSTQWSWPPDESIDFVAPGYMGWRSGEPEGPYWGQMGRSEGWEQTRQGFMNFKLENQYVGAIPVVLALFAVFATFAHRVSGRQGAGRRAEVAQTGVSADGGRPKSLGATSYLFPDTRHLTPDTSWRDRRAEIIFWTCAGVIALLLSFGKFFPLYALFYKLPVVNNIRNPNKFLQVFQLALGILAAYGLDTAVRWGRQTGDHHANGLSQCKRS